MESPIVIDILSDSDHYSDDNDDDCIIIETSSSYKNNNTTDNSSNNKMKKLEMDSCDSNNNDYDQPCSPCTTSWNSNTNMQNNNINHQELVEDVLIHKNNNDKNQDNEDDDDQDILQLYPSDDDEELLKDFLQQQSPILSFTSDNDKVQNEIVSNCLAEKTKLKSSSHNYCLDHKLQDVRPGPVPVDKILYDNQYQDLINNVDKNGPIKKHHHHHHHKKHQKKSVVDKSQDDKYKHKRIPTLVTNRRSRHVHGSRSSSSPLKNDKRKSRRQRRRSMAPDDLLLNIDAVTSYKGSSRTCYSYSRNNYDTRRKRSSRERTTLGQQNQGRVARNPEER